MQVRFTTTLVCALSCFACSGLGSDDGGENPDPGEGLSDAETNGNIPDTRWAAQTAAAVTAASGVVVSFTFDDTFSSQLEAASMLEAHDLTATLYVNSPRLHQAQAGADNSTYLSLAEARELELRGHEIGGHTLSHLSLTALGTAERRREVQNDRRELTRLGFDVRSLAYPFGDVEADLAAVREVVRSAGYLGARDTNGVALTRCGRDAIESLPPRDPYRVRSVRSLSHVPPAPLAPDDAATVLSWMDHVASCGGGWLPLVFHHFREDCSAANAPEAYCFEYAELEQLSSLLAEGERCYLDGEIQRCYPVSVVNFGAQLAGPTPAPGAEIFALRNASLERTLASGNTECLQRTQATDGTATFARSTTIAHSGQASERMQILAPYVAPAEMRVSRDFGACATFTSAGQRYDLSLWYRADPGAAPPTLRLIVHRLTTDYSWLRWIFEPQFSAASPGQWAQAALRTEPVPEGTLAISFGLRLESAGAVHVDDFALSSAGSGN
jgi:peptidoglycan/xylan/chitin deacetylase (PgdA/CDA1 family)